MKSVRFIAEAREEFLAEIAYYNKAQPGLGARFLSAVEWATSMALEFPLAGSPAVSNTRRVLLKDFPLSLFYRAEGDDIVIFALSHHVRPPGYWTARADGG